MSYSSNVNIINEKNFKEVVDFVFETVSDILVRSLGPYGATTIIEKYGDIHITKDGWNILKKITFDDLKANTILNLLVKIASQVVVNVGDGSTTSIVSANKLYKILNKDKNILTKRPKELVDEISDTVDKIVKYLEDNATMIDLDNDPHWSEHINLVALVSTNNNEDIANIIEHIYKETQNPTIEFGPSKTSDTLFEIVEGYKLSRCPFIDRVYINSEMDGKCNIPNPMVAMFDTTIDIENANEFMEELIQKATDEKRRLVIFAPYMDRFVMERIKHRANTEFTATGSSRVVYVRPNLTTDYDRLFFKDLSVLLGCDIITDEIVMLRSNRKHEYTMSKSSSSEPLEAIDVSRFTGYCGHIAIDSVDTLVSGFININQYMFDITLKDTRARYEAEMALSKKANNLSGNLYNAKQRMAKLYGKMGIIHVGGDSNLEKTSNMDLVEDAIKACESAFYNGYNTGGNIAIIDAAHRLAQTEPGNLFYYIIRDAFRDTLFEILNNKYKKINGDDSADDELINSIIDDMVKESKCVSIIDGDDKEIINSSMTDIEILKATVSIISLLISSNQYVTIEPMKSSQ